jgi:hypothetical protein
VTHHREEYRFFLEKVKIRSRFSKVWWKSFATKEAETAFWIILKIAEWAFILL